LGGCVASIGARQRSHAQNAKYRFMMHAAQAHIHKMRQRAMDTPERHSSLQTSCAATNNNRPMEKRGSLIELHPYAQQ
jgi:hypothetical protein